MRTIKFDKMLGLITNRLSIPSNAGAGYTLLLGAGFSHGVIPTAYEILSDAPIWLYENKRNPKDKRSTNSEIVREFWRKAKKEDTENILRLDEKTGLPIKDCASNAYQFLMSIDCHGGLNDLEKRRNYIRHLCSDTKVNNNPAHLYLACLLHQQTKAEWRYKTNFCKTILTTNFDPLLQHALQLVNVLYYMSDRPEVLDYLHEDDTNESIHLVYTHGSIHRYIVLNSKQEIEDAKTRNSSHLKSHFERHGVIVIGYGGWNDATMAALEQAIGFDGNLYWCKRREDSLPPQAVDLLKKHPECAFHVEIPDANEAMSQLFQKLTGRESPELLTDPIGMTIGQIERLKIIENERYGNRQFVDFFNSQIEELYKRLEFAQDAFKNPEKYNSITGNSQAVASKYLVDGLNFANNNKLYNAIKEWTKILSISDAIPEEKAAALIHRAIAYSDLSETDKEVNDYTAVINMDGVSAERKAIALINRALVNGKLQDKENDAINDYASAITITNVPSKLKATALLNQAEVYSRLNPPETAKALANYEAIINMPDSPDIDKLKAHANLGILSFKENNNVERFFDEMLKALDLQIKFHCIDDDIHKLYYNMGIAELYKNGRKNEKLILNMCIPSINNDPDIGSINFDINLLESKENILPSGSQKIYNTILAKLRERKLELESQK